MPQFFRGKSEFFVEEILRVENFSYGGGNFFRKIFCSGNFYGKNFYDRNSLCGDRIFSKQLRHLKQVQMVPLVLAPIDLESLELRKPVVSPPGTPLLACFCILAGAAGSIIFLPQSQPSRPTRRELPGRIFLAASAPYGSVYHCSQNLVAANRLSPRPIDWHAPNSTALIPNSAHLLTSRRDRRENISE